MNQAVMMRTLLRRPFWAMWRVAQGDYLLWNEGRWWWTASHLRHTTPWGDFLEAQEWEDLNEEDLDEGEDLYRTFMGMDDDEPWPPPLWQH